VEARALTSYRHTQIGTTILAGVGVAVVLLGMVGYLAKTLHWMLPAMALLALIAALFGSLTTEIVDRELRCRFGIGLIRKRFPLGRVVRIETVRNAWHWGWGIRYTPHGWLFNVSGLSAVELSMTDGKCVRIGTDRPEELARALRQAIETTPHSPARP
jgi:hypothetical protein